MKRMAIGLAVLLGAASLGFGQSDPEAQRILKIIRRGLPHPDQIQTLRVEQNATVGGTVTVTGPITASGAQTNTGPLVASSSLTVEGVTTLNDDVDVNLSRATDKVTLDMTNTAPGAMNVPLIAVTDARTGTNADATAEATLYVNSSATYGLAVAAGKTSLQALEVLGTNILTAEEARHVVATNAAKVFDDAKYIVATNAAKVFDDASLIVATNSSIQYFAAPGATYTVTVDTAAGVTSLVFTAKGALYSHSP